MILIGTKLVNRYQILEKIGAGGMAVVYKARCTLLNRVVAIKILRQQYAVDDDFVRRFRREAQAAASLSHPNIVSIYDVGQENDLYFIVMEYVDGETLKELIERKGPLQLSDAVAFTRQIAAALYHAHKNKIIHRDIKPHNVLITKDGRAKVTDFGIARAVSAVTQTYSPHSLLGSVHYFSPEQARGKMATEQSDLYSLGIVLYEMLTNRVPFHGDSPITIAMQHIQQSIEPADKFNPRVTPAINTILDKLLHKDIGKRYQNVADLIADLRRWNIIEAGDSDTAVFSEEPEAEEEADRTQEYTPPKAAKPLFGKITRAQLIKYGAIALAVLVIALLGYLGANLIANLLVVPETEVPEVVGVPLNEAIELLDQAGLDYEVESEKFHDEIPAEHVISQHPAGGRVVKQNRVISLTVSIGPDLVEIPSLVGFEQREATIVLDELGLEYAIETEFNEEVERDRVISQSPAAGRIPRSEKVTLYVSLGPRPVEMEDLVGKTDTEARRIIEELLLIVGSVRMEPADDESPGGIVTWQSMSPDEEVPPGTRVDLRIRPFNRILHTVEFALDPDLSYVIRIVVDDVARQSQEVKRINVSGLPVFEESVLIWERGTIRVYANDVLVYEKDV